MSKLVTNGHPGGGIDSGGDVLTSEGTTVE